MTAQSAEVSILKRKLERANEDLVLVNTRLDQAQGRRYILLYAFLCPCLLRKFKRCNVRVCTDGVSAVETLRGELAQAKKQARVSKEAADKAAADLMAE